jgi:hypothetical protein
MTKPMPAKRLAQRMSGHSVVTLRVSKQHCINIAWVSAEAGRSRRSRPWGSMATCEPDLAHSQGNRDMTWSMDNGIRKNRS